MAAALKSSRVAIECAIRRGCCKLPQATPAVCKCLSRCMSSPSSCETGSHVHNDKSETRDCWSCGQCINKFNLFCGSCEYIQPLDGKINFFQLLQLPQTFDLSITMLEKSFKNLQKAVHPDLFGTRSRTEQELSADASSNINIAYKVLRNPVTRAQYLLQLHGIDAIGESAGTAAVSSDLLMEIMEGRELLDDDSDSNAPRVGALQQDTDDRVKALLKDFSKLYNAMELQKAAEVTVALQYLTKLQAESIEWLARHAHQQILQKQAAVAAQHGHDDHECDAPHVHGPGCNHHHHHHGGESHGHSKEHHAKQHIAQEPLR